MGLLTRNYATLFRKYFKEMAKLRGIHVIYQYPIEMQFSNGHNIRRKSKNEYIT